MMEQYQDVWIKGQPERLGIRDCQSRYEIIRRFCSNYQRPFTILDVGANLCYFCIRLCEDFPELSSLAVEGRAFYATEALKVLRANEQSRIMLCRHTFSLKSLQALAKVEHFDVVLALSVAHHFKSPFEQTVQALQELGDHVILEVAVEGNACGQRVVRNQIIPSSWPIIGYGESHLVNDAKRPIYLLSRAKHSLPAAFMGETRAKIKRVIEISSDFQHKTIAIEGKDVRPYHRGINLCTFLRMGGVYPPRETIAKFVRESYYRQGRHHGDLSVWNVIFSGDSATLIDYDDVCSWMVDDVLWLAQLEADILQKR